MSLKAKLAELRSRRRSPPLPPHQPKVILAAQAIAAAAVRVEPIEPPDRDAIADRLRTAFLNGTEPDRKDLKDAAWCIWDGERPLARDSAVLDKYLRLVQNSGSRRLFRKLASVYLIDFPRNDPTLARVGRRLEVIAERYADRPGDPWFRASRALYLFDPKSGPERVAEEAFRTGSTPSRVLETFGIGGLASETGFGEAAYLAGLDALRRQRPSDPRAHLERAKTWAVRPDGGLYFEQHRLPLVEAVVLPWAETVLPKETRDVYLSFLLSRFGDPRLTEANKWTQMAGTPAERLVRRWLTDRSLRQFLDVVDANALERHWKYRRAFWEAVYRRDLIADAWVIFDPSGVDAARQIFKDETPYGRWLEPVDWGQACLLLRVGRGVVAEWSHNGRCHIWRDAGDRTAPKLYQDCYRKHDARLGDAPEFDGISITHHNPETYYWQKKIAEEIYTMTGVRILHSDYAVRE